MLRAGAIDMNTNMHNDPEYWGQEIARINTRIDEFQARFEAECHILRGTVDTQLEELRAALRRLEADIAAISPDAYAQKIAAQVEELKLKGDAAYGLMEARLRGGDPQYDTTSEGKSPLQ